MNFLIAENDQIMDSLTLVLGCEEENSTVVKSHAVMLLNTITYNIMERLKPEIFETIVKVFHVMLRACHRRRNRIMMLESGAVFELIEIELHTPEKCNTELTMKILFHLCNCADGRAQFLSHKGAIALLTEQIFTISLAVDERVVFVLSLLSMFSATRVVLQEMVEVGTVSKLCRLLQSDHHGTHLKDKAREILKAHDDFWRMKTFSLHL